MLSRLWLVLHVDEFHQWLLCLVWSHSFMQMKLRESAAVLRSNILIKFINRRALCLHVCTNRFFSLLRNINIFQLLWNKVKVKKTVVLKEFDLAQALSTSSDWCCRHSKEAAAKAKLEEDNSALRLWVHVTDPYPQCSMLSWWELLSKWVVNKNNHTYIHTCFYQSADWAEESASVSGREKSHRDQKPRGPASPPQWGKCLHQSGKPETQGTWLVFVIIIIAAAVYWYSRLLL